MKTYKKAPFLVGTCLDAARTCCFNGCKTWRVVGIKDGGGKMNTVQPIREREKINEMKHYLKQRSDRDHLLFVMGINLGLRISDLLRLIAAGVAKDFHTLKEHKTGKTRRVYFNETLRYIGISQDMVQQSLEAFSL